MHPHKLSDDAVNDIISSYKYRDKEYGANALARKYGVSRHTIRNVLNGETYTWVKRPGVKTSTVTKRRYVSDDVVRAIRAEHEPYLVGNIKMLTEKYSVHRNTIYKILEGKIYADVQ